MPLSYHWTQIIHFIAYRTYLWAEMLRKGHPFYLLPFREGTRYGHSHPDHVFRPLSGAIVYQHLIFPFRSSRLTSLDLVLIELISSDWYDQAFMSIVDRNPRLIHCSWCADGTMCTLWLRGLARQLKEGNISLVSWVILPLFLSKFTACFCSNFTILLATSIS